MLVEVICKAVSVEVNCQIGAAVNFQYMLHSFRAFWGKGTISLEAKLLHQMEEMRGEVLYEVFLDL